LRPGRAGAEGRATGPTGRRAGPVAGGPARRRGAEAPARAVGGGDCRTVEPNRNGRRRLAPTGHEEAARPARGRIMKNLTGTSEAVSEASLDVIATEYLKAVEAGDVPDRPTWLARHP